MHTQKQNKQIQRSVEGQLFFLKILFDTHYCYFPVMPIESRFSRLIKSKLINLLRIQ